MFAAEAIIVWFKAFAVLTKLTFKWFEKQNDESSNVSHRVEDSLKNLKSASDLLIRIHSERGRGALLNMMGDTMILCLCSVGDQQKWNFVEARPTIIPIL
ncbi:hypothetical protein G6F42_013790 [Rhizopus arrhizus]|nr:hypothetical protein G6F42_013790 [Rhizopus arrhizus]